MLLPSNVQDTVTLIQRNVHVIAAGDPEWGAAFERAIPNYLSKKEVFELPYLIQLRRYPVDVDTFVHGNIYLNKPRGEIYPAVLEELSKINNPGGVRVVNPYSEAVFTGGIGSTKSTTALYTVAYQLYVLSCFKNPHQVFGLDTASEILFIFQAIGDTAESDYQRFLHMIKASPYFNNVYPWDKRIQSKLKFPGRVEVKPIESDTGTIGQNVLGGMLDEVNWMAVTTFSKKSLDGGIYDQARTIYNSISRRRKSRFLKQGKAPGILCLVSSKRYPGEFTDVKIVQSKNDPSIYVFEKNVWDMKPPGTFTNGYFRLFKGDLLRKARVVNEGESLDRHAEIIADEYLQEDEVQLTMLVPNDFLGEFKEDMIGSLRDIAGVSVTARYPFITNGEAVNEMFQGGESILNLEETDMESTTLQFFPSKFKNKEWPRWVHIDLGLTSDSAGVCCGYVPKFVFTEDGLLMPQINLDFLLRVKPPPNKEIQFYKIRNLLVKLKESGIPIQYVTFDLYQSADSIQLLRHLGFSTGKISTTTGLMPYMVCKTAIYQRRIKGTPSKRCHGELLSLEMYTTVGKHGVIDHPPGGNKDLADALACVVYGLTTRRETWLTHGVPITQAVAAFKEISTTEGVKDGTDPDADDGQSIKPFEHAQKTSFA
jgi:hypothetical protein